MTYRSIYCPVLLDMVEQIVAEDGKSVTDYSAGRIEELSPQEFEIICADILRKHRISTMTPTGFSGLSISASLRAHTRNCSNPLRGAMRSSQARLAAFTSQFLTGCTALKFRCNGMAPILTG